MPFRISTCISQRHFCQKIAFVSFPQLKLDSDLLRQLISSFRDFNAEQSSFRDFNAEQSSFRNISAWQFFLLHKWVRQALKTNELFLIFQQTSELTFHDFFCCLFLALFSHLQCWTFLGNQKSIKNYEICLRSWNAITYMDWTSTPHSRMSNDK